jgi:hypothetical protein
MLEQSRLGAARNLVAAVAAALVAGVAQPVLGEEAHGVEVLPVVEAQAQAPAQDAADEATSREAESAEEPLVLVLDVTATSVTLDYGFPPPDVSARGWEPGAPSRIRVHGAGTGDPSRIPVRGWEPRAPRRLRVHSWIAGTP